MLTPHAIPGYLAVRVKLSPPAARDLNFTPHAGCPGSPAQYSSLDCSETTFIGRIYRSSCFWSRSPASCLSGGSSRSGSSGRCFCSPSCSEVRTVSRLRVEHCAYFRLLQQSTEPFRATPGRATLSSSLPSKLRAGSAFTRSLTSEFEVRLICGMHTYALNTDLRPSLARSWWRSSRITPDRRVTAPMRTWIREERSADGASAQIRHGFWLILTMFILAIPILAQVDMDGGRADAEEFQRQVLNFREVDEDVPP